MARDRLIGIFCIIGLMVLAVAGVAWLIGAMNECTMRERGQLDGSAELPAPAMVDDAVTVRVITPTTNH